ncbi:hypothetical protein W97_05215 [Coniosporium apollinis CBS 100218]|uniref:FAD-binding PCMH-type domain-containing protein n=1 Tax=Coniosporium apollinis (strain CBS 100218) TaxID=1168221 RepID=R7YVV2_CONA1|nr:uncharacterized protein W97_05215 [Coniosporium apollinis CBS 100218]EON65973.1 hypothetical protein W97_05215 [Coniosporium apollinis CBS 100218]
MLLIQIIAVAFIQNAFICTVRASSTECKCTPSDHCWPSDDDWSTLNDTLSGRLIRGVPPASVCYQSSPNYNPTSCAHVASQWTNSSFHAEDPISIDYPIWANNSCPPIFPNGTSVTGDPNAGNRGCSLGRYPVYVVNATEASHVQAALKFAKERNIRLNVKNTGHNFPGRSTAFGSLSIWTHHFRGITFHDDFKPDSCSLNTTGEQMAATIAAGEQGFTVYEAMAEHGAIAVGGANPTVGIVGWFTGGGHGWLSSTYGMGADNLLQATVVTPDGEVVVINACLHPELFFAIRGGGGGTYGIILEAVMKAYPTPQTTFFSLQLALLNPNATSEYWDLMAYIHSEMPRLNEGGMQGYYGMLGPPVAPTLAMYGAFFLYDKPNGTVEALFAPIKDRLDRESGLVFHNTTVQWAPTFFDMYKAVIMPESVATGGSAMGSRLIPKQTVTEEVEHVARMFEAIGPKLDVDIQGFAANPVLLGHMIANSDNRDLDIGLNPAWRDAVTHLIVIEGWNEGAPREEIDAVYEDITHNKTYTLRELAPDSGAYFNECDPFEPDWQFAFFGKNYQRLRQVKKTYDPDGLLWCRSCVGSEEWVEEADGSLCRLEWANGKNTE